MKVRDTQDRWKAEKWEGRNVKGDKENRKRKFGVKKGKMKKDIWNGIRKSGKDKEEEQQVGTRKLDVVIAYLA